MAGKRPAIFERGLGQRSQAKEPLAGETESLQLKYAGKEPAVLLERKDLTPQIVATFVRQGVLLMAPFRKTEITDAELAALATYIADYHKAHR